MPAKVIPPCFLHLASCILPHMFSLFTSKPLLDEASRQWLFDTYDWALRNFDAELFYSHTRLILPTNEYFPGQADSPAAMANLILDQVKVYAGTRHWPTRVVDQNACPTITTPRIAISGALRDPHGAIDTTIDDTDRLLIPYNPQQINNPEGMIATFAHILAHYMGQMGQEAPPGGMEFWPQATELLAIYLGFGVMFANSAFTFRGGCGSCYNPPATREASLPELEANYALALFAVLKGISTPTVTPHLKKHLRGFYKKAVKEIEGQNREVDQLKSIRGTSSENRP